MSDLKGHALFGIMAFIVMAAYPVVKWLLWSILFVDSDLSSISQVFCVLLIVFPIGIATHIIFKRKFSEIY